MNINDAIHEVLDDIGADPEGTLRRAEFLDEAMPCVRNRLNATYAVTAPMVQMLSILRGDSPQEQQQAVRDNALCGSFSLGVMVGLELQKRGYTPPVDTTLDTPSV